MTGTSPSAPLWLAHHHGGELHRCARVGNTLVCRRCLAAHPVSWLVMILSLAGIGWPVGLDPVILWALPAIAVLEYSAENLGLLRYSARRQAVVSFLCGIAFGRGLARQLRNPGDSLFWTVTLTASGVMVGSLIINRRQRAAAERKAEEDEAEREWRRLEAELFAS
jgi:uncharacterized membrane protein